MLANWLRVAGGDGLWTPAEITTALWLDADDASTITEVSGAVSAWADKSGNGYLATQATASSRPLYQSTAFNGKAALVFNGTDNGQMLLSNALLSDQHSVFFVAERGNQTTLTASILRPVMEVSLSDSNNTTGLRSYGTQRGTLQNLEGAIELVRVPTISGSWLLGHKKLASFIYDQATLDGYDNGDYYGQVSNTTGSVSDFIAIGGSVSPITVRRFAGKISEVLILNYPADSGARQKIEGYLAWKWGLESNLPAAHPYKNSAP